MEDIEDALKVAVEYNAKWPVAYAKEILESEE